LFRKVLIDLTNKGAVSVKFAALLALLRTPLRQVRYPTSMLGSLSPEAQDWVEAGFILAAFWIPAALFRIFWKQILGPWINKSSNPKIALLIRPVRAMVSWGLILGGLNLAYQSLEFALKRPTLSEWVTRGITIAWVVLAIYFTTRLVAGAFQYQAQKANADGEYRNRTTTSQKLATGAIIVFGALFILRIGGIDISPLLAGGAVGGVIIGLALQDSLSNVFAGLFLNMDRPIKVGDLLKLDQDREGFVEEVGWRYTKVRLWNDSLLMIPNNKFGQSTFINFNRPDTALNTHVECGIAYDSDLDHVERVAIAAAKAAQDAANDRETEFEPYVRWRSFGDSAIVFRVFMRVDEATAQYRANHYCIKEMHRRFKAEGIDIPFPIRTLIHTNSSNSDSEKPQ